MPPQFFDAGQFVQHPLEALFNASGWDILSAIEKGFRAQVDVKGKLAELFLYLQLETMRSSGAITALEWRDKDGVPDFLLSYGSRDFQVECKNVRSPTRPRPGITSRPRPSAQAPPTWRVEIQKTRNQLTGGPARGYKADEFDILAVCLFNQNRRWEYLFISTANLIRRPQYPDYLEIMQPVPPVPQGHWKAMISEVLSDLVGP